MLNKYAEELKQIRESTGLTLQQVAVKTKIDYKFLHAIESGDFEFLPGLYVKAFLREYIKVLDLDEQLYTKKYEAARLGKIYEEETIPAEKTKEPPQKAEENIPHPEPHKSPRRLTNFDVIRNFKKHEEESSASRRRKKAVTYYLTIGTVFFAGLLYLFLFSGEDEIVVPEKPWEEIVEQVHGINDQTESVGAMTYDSVFVENKKGIAADSLYMLIKAVDTSWIRIRIDDSRTEEFILFPGSQKAIKASDNYKIFLGNARGINIDLNEKPLSFNPKNISVLRMQIDSNGIKELDQNTIIE